MDLRAETRVLFFEETCFLGIIHCMSANEGEVQHPVRYEIMAIISKIKN